MKKRFDVVTRLRRSFVLGGLIAALALSTTPQAQAQELTPLQKRANAFSMMISNYGANFFRGNALNFSSFNLSLVMDIMFSPPLTPTSPFTFNLATNGNQLSMSPEAAVFPVSGSVQFEVRDSDGKLKTFIGPDDESLTFPVADHVAYLVENRASFAARVKRQAILADKLKSPIYEAPVGPLLSVISVGVDGLNAQFFQISTDGQTLVPAGVYSGKSIHP